MARARARRPDRAAPRRPDRVDGEVLVGPGPRDRRVAAHRRGRPGGQGRWATRCSRAASWPWATAWPRATAVGEDTHAYQLSAEAKTLLAGALRAARRREPPDHLDRLGHDPHRRPAHLGAGPRRPRLPPGRPGLGGRPGGHGARRAGAAHQRGLRRERHPPGPAPGADPGAGRHRRPGPGRRDLPRQDGHAHRGRPGAGDRSSRSDPERTRSTTDALLAALAAADDHPNPSLRAIGAGSGADPGWSRHRHHAVLVGPQVERGGFADHGAWLLGAPDILLAGAMPDAPAVRRARGHPAPATVAGCCWWPPHPTVWPRRRTRAARRPGTRGAGGARRAAAALGARHHRLLRSPGRDRQGHLRRQPRRRWGRWPATAACPAPRTRSTPASSPTTRPSWPRCSKPTACSAGSRPSRSEPWSTPCRLGATWWP